MSCAPYRKRCPQCNEMRVYTRKLQKWCSVPCAIKGLAARGHHRYASRCSHAKHPWSTATMQAELRALDASPALIAYAIKLRHRAYAAGHSTGRDAGYREGFAEALGERETRRRVA